MLKKETPANPYYRLLMRNIVVIIIGAAFIPLVVVSSTIYYQFRTSYREKVQDHLRELVQKHTQRIDNFLNEKLANIKLLASSFSYDRLADESFLRERLEVMQKAYGPVFVDLGVINARGEQISYAGPFKLTRANYSDADWFRQASQQLYFISDVFLGLRDLPHFIVAVRNSHQGQTWILRATIDFVAFNMLVNSIQIGQTGFAFILNQKGEVQTTPITKSLTEILPSKDIYTEFWGKSNASPDGIRIIVKQDNSKHHNIYVAAFLKNGHWLLVYQQRAKDAYADLNRTFIITTVIMMLGTLAIAVTALTLSRMIVNRIAKADTEKQMMDEKVVQAGKMASVGELAAGIAHEINNPVAIMVEEAGWMKDLLEEEEFQHAKNLDEYTRAINQIQTQGKRCKEITHKLLSFARKTDGTLQDTAINDLLEEVVALTSQRAKYGMVEIHTHLQPDLPAVEVSPSEMQQVFFNLINNALDAMEDRGGTLTIGSRQLDRHLVVEVSDTGKGIPEANIHRIFDPFFTTKSIGKGTGLGLSICYGIIDKMGGKIECKSAVGHGTTFYVYIPLQKGKPDSSQQS